jgi:hypothetical protein
MKELIEREGHFRITNQSNFYNAIYPINKMVTFKYVKN